MKHSAVGRHDGGEGFHPEHFRYRGGSHSDYGDGHRSPQDLHSVFYYNIAIYGLERWLGSAPTATWLDLWWACEKAWIRGDGRDADLNGEQRRGTVVARTVCIGIPCMHTS